MIIKEKWDNLWQLTLLPALRRMFGKHRKGNTILLICAFYLIGAMLGVICLSYHVNLRENARLATDYESYIRSTAAASDAATSEAAKQALRHILFSKIELTSVFVFLMIVWGILSAFSLARVFHATVEQDKYVFGLYVTFGSDTRQIRRRIYTEFALAALAALSIAIPTATVITHAIYRQNGQPFRPGLAPFLQIFLWLFTVSLIGAGYLSHQVTKSTCIQLMAALDCSDYVSSPRTSRRLSKRHSNGTWRYARLAIRRMRKYYIPLVLTVSVVAAVFFGSMNLALGGERAARDSIHEYTIEFSRGLSSKELDTGYIDHLMAVEDVESVDALANGRADMLGTHLLASKELFSATDDGNRVDCGTYFATEDIHILCADSNTRAELGGKNVLPGNWENFFNVHDKGFNYSLIPEAGTVIYLYPKGRETELNVRAGDTLQLAIPLGEAGRTLGEKVADGRYEYLSLIVSDVVAIPDLYYVTPLDATYIGPRITEDYLLLNPEDYAGISQSETIEKLSLDELYREDFRFGSMKSPAVLLLPEDYEGTEPTTLQMFAPRSPVTEQYSVTDPMDTNRKLYLESDTFYLNRTAYHTYFYFGTAGEYNNDSDAIDRMYGIENRSLFKYDQTELTVVECISCPGLTAPCIILPNDGFLSSYESDLCIFRLSENRALYEVSEEIFAFGTDGQLMQDEYIGSQLFLHTEIEAGFFDEMQSQGLYTSYPDESAYDLSSFQIISLFDLNRYTYFLCSLSNSCNLGMDRYPAYMAPGNDFIFLNGLTEATDMALPEADSYLRFHERLQKQDSEIITLTAGDFYATNDLTVSVSDHINQALLTPDLDIPTLSPGEAVLVISPYSGLTVEADSFIQMAVQGDFSLDLRDPQVAGLSGNDLLRYMVETKTPFRHISLKVIDVIQGDGEEDILYLSEKDWQRIRRTDSTYQSLDIHLYGDTDLVSLIKTSARIRALMGNWQSSENLVTLVDHNRLWSAVTTGACNYPAIIRTLSIMLILLLPLLWCCPQRMHFHKRRGEFEVMHAVGKTNCQLRRMIAGECLIITFLSGAFVALLCPFSVLCVRAAIYMLELPFATSDFDMRAYLFMILFVMLCSALSFLTVAPKCIDRTPKEKNSKKGAD